MTEKKTKVIIVTTRLTFVSMIEATTPEDYAMYLPRNVKTFECSDKEFDYRFYVDADLLNQDTFISTLLYRTYQNTLREKKEDQASFTSAC